MMKNHPHDASHQADQIQYSQRNHPFESLTEMLAMTLSE